MEVWGFQNCSLDVTPIKEPTLTSQSPTPQPPQATTAAPKGPSLAALTKCSVATMKQQIYDSSFLVPDILSQINVQPPALNHQHFICV